MKKKRNRRILIKKEENRLLSNSVVIEQYPMLKNILNKYLTLYERDMKNNKDFDDRLNNLILYVFEDIVDEAVKEWRGNGEMDIAESEEVYCSLCKRKNKYIFYIKNIHSDAVLNVGSECIDKFPKLKTGLPEGMTARQYKNKKIREYEKLKRLEEFNLRFPDAKNMLRKWNKEYHELSIIPPIELGNTIRSIHIRANQIFEDFLKDKGTKEDLSEFEKLIIERGKSIEECNIFASENKNEILILTRQIYDWILKESPYKAKLINQIKNNKSRICKKTLPYIYESGFLNRNLISFNEMLKNTEATIERIGNNNVYIRFRDSKRKASYYLLIPNKDFMESYGAKLFEENPRINEKEIISKSRFVNNLDNLKNIKLKLEKILKESNYEIELDYDNLNRGLEFIDKMNKRFTDQISPIVFFNAQKEKILFENKESKKDICEVIKSIQRWRPLSDKEKYDVGDISKAPTGN